MELKQNGTSRTPRRSILATLFYSIAGLVVVVGAILLVLQAIARGSFGVASRNWTEIVTLVNFLIIAVFFWAAGAALSYLHDMREYTKMIAAKLLQDPKPPSPSEN